VWDRGLPESARRDCLKEESRCVREKAHKWQGKEDGTAAGGRWEAKKGGGSRWKFKGGEMQQGPMKVRPGDRF